MLFGCGVVLFSEQQHATKRTSNSWDSDEALGSRQHLHPNLTVTAAKSLKSDKLAMARKKMTAENSQGAAGQTTRDSIPQRKRRNTKTAPGDDNSSTMIHVDAHRGYFYAQAKPNTHVEEDQSEGGKVCGCLVNAIDGTRQAASAWQEEVEKALHGVNIKPGASSPRVFPLK